MPSTKPRLWSPERPVAIIIGSVTSDRVGDGGYRFIKEVIKDTKIKRHTNKTHCIVNEGDHGCVVEIDDFVET